ncbi:hypothetical protein D3C71_1559550 [compost metagenome]
MPGERGKEFVNRVRQHPFNGFLKGAQGLFVGFPFLTPALFFFRRSRPTPVDWLFKRYVRWLRLWLGVFEFQLLDFWSFAWLFGTAGRTALGRRVAELAIPSLDN